MTDNKGHGLIVPEIVTREQGAEHIFRSSGLTGHPINLSGSWMLYLPEKEPQSKRGIETNACVPYGTLNAIETLLRFKNIEVNYSDRALAIASDTDPYRGNDPNKVAETIRKKLGCVVEVLLPFSDEIKTVEEYYKPNPLPEYIIANGNKFFDTWEFSHEWVFPRNASLEQKKTTLKDALRRGPVCVSVSAWYIEGDVYVKPAGAGDNHWCQLMRYDEKDRPIIFDSYDGYVKTLHPDYDFDIAKVYYLFPAKQKISLMQEILTKIAQMIPLLTFLVKKKVEEKFVTLPDESLPSPSEPKSPEEMNVMQKESLYEWGTKEKVRHSIRVIGDENGLNVWEKNLICAVIQAESGFDTKRISELNTNGTHDFGLCQFNDGENKEGVPYWIGTGADFKDTDEVLNDPAKNVRVMIREYKAGRIKYWTAYSNGSYKKFL